MFRGRGRADCTHEDFAAFLTMRSCTSVLKTHRNRDAISQDRLWTAESTTHQLQWQNPI